MCRERVQRTFPSPFPPSPGPALRRQQCSFKGDHVQDLSPGDSQEAASRTGCRRLAVSPGSPAVSAGAFKEEINLKSSAPPSAPSSAVPDREASPVTKRLKCVR